MLKHHSKNDIFALDLVNCVDSCVAERQYKSKHKLQMRVIGKRKLL